jgi:hypothetical protein
LTYARLPKAHSRHRSSCEAVLAVLPDRGLRRERSGTNGLSDANPTLSPTLARLGGHTVPARRGGSGQLREGYIQELRLNNARRIEFIGLLTGQRTRMLTVQGAGSCLSGLTGPKISDLLSTCDAGLSVWHVDCGSDTLSGTRRFRAQVPFLVRRNSQGKARSAQST